jgi:methyl-accepting chemotaxis protein
MNFSKKSLIWRMIITINITLFIILSVLGFEIFQFSQNNSEELIKKEMQTLSSQIAISSIEFFLHEDIVELDFVSNKLTEDKDIDHVVFKNADGKELASSDTKNDLKKSEKIFKEIKDERGKALGSVELYFNHNRIEMIKERLLYKIIFFIAISIFMLTSAIYLILRRTVNSVQGKVLILETNAKTTQQSSNKAKSISEQLSSATTQQASSIQETVSTLEQMKSQVDLTLNNVQKSAQKAIESNAKASSGKTVVIRMADSMKEIETANSNIIDEISKGNERIAGIVKIINEISQKTAVINDIVFQTKLLSFNASVEAARAGEHGKGFAVVAEEVGNLAQMSGKASKEISEILSDSISKVNSVIIETNENVKNLVLVGNQKVKNGSEVAGECGIVLDEIVGMSSVVKDMLNQISIATKEQVEGVNNISTAMTQLDQTTSSIHKSAVECFDTSKSLTNQTEVLVTALKELDVEINGRTIKTKSIMDSNLKKVEVKPTLPKSIVSTTAPVAPSTTPSQLSTKEVNSPQNSFKQMVKRTVEKASPIKSSDKKAKLSVVKNETKSITIQKLEEVKKPAVNPNAIPSHDDPRFEDV